MNPWVKCSIAAVITLLFVTLHVFLYGNGVGLEAIVLYYCIYISINVQEIKDGNS